MSELEEMYVACVYAEFKRENPGKRFTFKIQYRLATAESNSSQQRKIKYIHGGVRKAVGKFTAFINTN